MGGLLASFGAVSVATNSWESSVFHAIGMPRPDLLEWIVPQPGSIVEMCPLRLDRGEILAEKVLQR